MNKEYGVTEEQLTSDMPASAPLTVKAKVSPDTGSVGGRDLSGITLEKLRQIDEYEISFDRAKLVIGIAHSKKFKQYQDEKNKPHPNESLVAKLKNESLQLYLEQDSLYNKNIGEIKKIINHYSKMNRDNN